MISFTRHRHKMVPVAVSPQELPVQMPFSAKASKTVVLFRCDDMHGPDCVEAKILPGTWSLHDLEGWPAQLRGVPEEEPVTGRMAVALPPETQQLKEVPDDDGHRAR